MQKRARASHAVPTRDSTHKMFTARSILGAGTFGTVYSVDQQYDARAAEPRRDVSCVLKRAKLADVRSLHHRAAALPTPGSEAPRCLIPHPRTGQVEVHQSMLLPSREEVYLRQLGRKWNWRSALAGEARAQARGGGGGGGGGADEQPLPDAPLCPEFLDWAVALDAQPARVAKEEEAWLASQALHKEALAAAALAATPQAIAAALAAAPPAPKPFRPLAYATIVTLCAMERVGCDLGSWVRRYPLYFAHEGVRRCIVRQMWQLLARLHSERLLHRDLRMDNLLLEWSVWPESRGGGGAGGGAGGGPPPQPPGTRAPSAAPSDKSIPPGYPLLRLCDLGCVRPFPLPLHHYAAHASACPAPADLCAAAAAAAAAQGASASPNPWDAAHAPHAASSYVTALFYRAPELVLGSRWYGPPSDVWAMSLTVAHFYALTGALVGQLGGRSVGRAVQQRGDGVGEKEMPLVPGAEAAAGAAAAQAAAAGGGVGARVGVKAGGAPAPASAATATTAATAPLQRLRPIPLLVEADSAVAAWRARGELEPPVNPAAPLHSSTISERCTLFHGSCDATQLLSFLNVLGSPSPHSLQDLRLTTPSAAAIRVLVQEVEEMARVGREAGVRLALARWLGAPGSAQEAAALASFREGRVGGAGAGSAGSALTRLQVEALHLASAGALQARPIEPLQDMAGMLAREFGVPLDIGALVAAGLQWAPSARITAAEALCHEAVWSERLPIFDSFRAGRGE